MSGYLSGLPTSIENSLCWSQCKRVNGSAGCYSGRKADAAVLHPLGINLSFENPPDAGDSPVFHRKMPPWWNISRIINNGECSGLFK